MKTNLLKKMLLSTLCVSVMLASIGVYSVETAQVAVAANNGGKNLTSRDYEKLGNETAAAWAEAKADAKEAESQVDKYTKEAEAAEKKVNTYNQVVKTYTDGVAKASKEVSKYNDTASKAKAKEDEYLSKAQEATAKADKLEKQLKKQSKISPESADKLQKEIKKLRSEAEKNKKSADKEHKKVEEAEKKASEFQQSVDKFQKQVDMYQQKADEAQSAAESAKKEAGEWQTLLNKINDQIKELDEDLSEYVGKELDAIDAEGGPLFSGLMWRFRDMDAAVAEGALAQSENLAQKDFSAQADLLDLDDEVAIGVLSQRGNLAQRDYETQADLLDLDSEVSWASFFGYHWWTLDYGLAREYALRPLEFGYFSYHSALNDTMGEFTTAETLYSGIFNAVSLGLSVLGALPDVVNQVEGFVDAIDDYRKTSIAEDMRVAKEAGDKFREQLAEEEAGIGDLHMQARASAMEAETLEAEASALDEKARDLRNQIYAATDKGDEAAVSALEAELRETHFASAEKRLAAEDKRAEADYYAGEAESHEKSIAALRANVDIADAKYAEADKELRSLLGVDDAQANLNAASAAADNAEGKLENSQENLAVIQANLSKEQDSYNQKAAAAAELQLQAAMVDKAMQSAENANDVASATAYYEELKGIQGQIGALNSEMAESQKTIDILSKGAASVQNEINQNKSASNAANNAITSGSADLRAKTAEYNVLAGKASEEDMAIYQQSQAQKAAAKQQSAQSAQNFSNQMNAMQPGNLITGVEQGGASIVNGVFNVFGLGR